MRKRIAHRNQMAQSSLPAGFTLVELLVAVGLVVLIMAMFAQVFRTASNLIAREKGMAENGQRSRTLTTIIQNDLQRRTFRHVAPWDPTESGTLADAENRQGYLYYSENSIGSDADNTLAAVDDVLQFTIRVGENESKLFGHALLMGGMDVTNINQPEADDGQVYLDGMNTPTLEDLMSIPNQLPNSLGASRWAEVAYFVRNGNLYRRVLLVREPYDASGGGVPVPIGGTVAYPGPESFWHDFDYSAYYNGTGPAFHDYQLSLDNTGGNAITPPTLGAPFYRFGFHRNVTSGNPREFTDPAAASDFIGRFTHQETSSPVFGYPGILNDLNGDATGDDPADSALPLAVVNGVVNYPGTDGMIGTMDDGAFDGPRQGEDILISNVQAFDVKVWDDGLTPPQFVDVGHGIAGGAFEQANDHHATPPVMQATITYGPHSNQTLNRIFDTWHPDLDFNGDAANDYAPYRPVTNGRDGQPGVAGVDDDGVNGIDDAGELGWDGSDDVRLRAIQITIRFFDVSSNQMKQMTLMQSLTE